MIVVDELVELANLLKFKLLVMAKTNSKTLPNDDKALVTFKANMIHTTSMD